MIHLSPGITALFLFSLYISFIDKGHYLNYLTEIKLDSYSEYNETSLMLEIQYDIIRYIHISQIILYSSMILKRIIKNQKKLIRYYLSIDKFQIKYFRLINYSFLILMAIPGLIAAILNRGIFNHNSILILLFSLIFACFYFILGMYAMKQIAGKAYKLDYQLDKKMKILKDKFVNYIVNKENYKNQYINIETVAKHLNSNKAYISKVVNAEFNMSFINYVNKHRVSLAKILIYKNLKLTNEEIARLSGFGSELSLIRSFKRFEKCKPSDYKKMIINKRLE
ncbi:MAG: helix-turn-helix domain-containing protein [Marinifilaceae bacterium]|nr:helix-turn-helix domain-containing protein [Marinifilaceae bacterium]